MAKDKFWMVLGGGLPTQRHLSKDTAKKEAERLARQLRGQEFVVLEAIGSVVCSDVRWEEFVDSAIDDGQPF